jgi:hypothetical protein
MALNKTNAFYAVDFWYFVLTLIILFEISDLVKASKFTSTLLATILLASAILFGIIVNLLLITGSWSHVGPNLSLNTRSYYDAAYRKKVIEYFDLCCSDFPRESFLVDDATYFILKKRIKFPVPVTYAGIFGNQNEIYANRRLQYSIIRCGAQKSVLDNQLGVVIEGGYGDQNVCFKFIGKPQN